MEQVHTGVLYMSKDKLSLTDSDGNIICNRVTHDGIVYYAALSIESEAYEKICRSVSARKVCTVWNDNYDCLIWDEVDICTRWQYIPSGFSNIS